MSSSRDADFQYQNGVSNDELAANLIKCAMMVKKGEKDPLLRQTIHDLTFYYTGKRVSGNHQNATTTTANTAAASTASSAAAASAPHQTSPRALSRHQSHTALGGVLSKIAGLGQSNSNDDGSSVSVRSEASKMATSAKNAERAKAELRGLGFSQTANQEWCDVHFTMGCHCKLKKNSAASGAGTGAGSSSTASAATASASAINSSQHPPHKPHFQRPTNPSSALIANGWIEQQRRSKMRIVWKEVLASLVEGRKPGEETTLWVQREVRNPTTGKPELEALHQIPVKWIQAVSFYTDRRFILKVYNLQEEFVFRCERSEEAAQNWVLTLRSIQDQERVKAGKKPVTTGLDDWDKLPTEQSSFEDEKKASEHTSHSSSSHRVAHATPQAAQAIAQHTAAMASGAQTSQHPSGTAAPAGAGTSHHQHPPPPQNQSPATASHGQGAAAPPAARMSIKELRSIAHGAGVMTHGMERSDLERVVHQISAAANPQRQPPAPPPPAAAPSSGNHASPPPTRHNGSSATAASEEEVRRRKHAEEHQRLMEESARQQKVADEAARARAAAEGQKKEDEKRKVQEEQQRQLSEAEKKKKEEEERVKLEAERKRREEEEHQRRLAEMQAAEQRRRQEEQQRQQQAQWQQQQQNWQKQQAETEARLAEERRRSEEAFRAQQQWQSQQAAAAAAAAGAPPPQQWQQQQHQQQHAHPMHPPHPHAPYGPPPPQQPYPPGQPPPGGHRSPPPPPHAPPGSSPVNMKYAQMAAQTGDAGQLSLQTIKHGILIEWGLQPPSMQILRPIEVLITSIHSVFPPKFGVPGHEHFKKWTVVTPPEVLSGTQPDDEKLNKVVRKLRFVLHPDKLPRDFSDDQMYMCKLLWDIISDAFEDHKKREEELGWMR